MTNIFKELFIEEYDKIVSEAEEKGFLIHETKVGKMVPVKLVQNQNHNHRKKILIPGIMLVIKVEQLKRYKLVAIC